MPQKLTSLKAIRRQIDQIDDDVHRLLVKRASLAGRVMAAKNKDGGLALRPEREAQILRRLLRRNQGNLSSDVVARIWRELIPAMARLQSPLEVCVCGADDTTTQWDLARSHFGSATPMTVVTTPKRALAAMKRVNRAGGCAIAVLPSPGGRWGGPWWSKLMSNGAGTPRIIGKLPFVKSTCEPSASSEAMVVGCLERRPSGDDQTLLALEARPRTSARQIIAWMEAARLSGIPVAAISRKGTPGCRLHIIQISEYVDIQDRRLEEFRTLAQGAVAKAIIVGGYPTCFEPKPSSKPSKKSHAK